MIDILDQAARIGVSGEKAALATVVRAAGSTPRRAGAKMILCEDRTLLGTVGGGKMESEVLLAARAVAAGDAGPTRWHKHLVRDLAMCCGGEMEVWIEPLDAPRAAVLADALGLRRARTPVALRTTLAPGAKSLIARDECLRTRQPRLEDGAFVEPVLPAERLVLFGSGHIALAAAPLAASVGFEVWVCDEDETLCTPDRFPDARRPGTLDVAELEREMDGGLGRGDYVLIVTRDHALDQVLLERLIGRADLSWLGMVGSRGKLGRFRRRLEARGITDEAAWGRLRSPAGLDIGADTPEEIALAIVAELVGARAEERKRACAPLP